MRFMILRKADACTEAGILPEEKLLAAMGQYNEELLKAGVMRAGEGLQPSATGVRLRFSHGKTTVIDGPFSETKELIAGFSMFEVPSKDEAIAWVKRWPALDGDGNVEIELREVGCANGLCGSEPTPAQADAASKQRYMVLLKSDSNTEATVDPGEQRLAAMARCNEDSVKAGIMLAGDGLQPTSRGARVKFAGGKPTVIDGPFAETKELIAGFWIIRTASKQEAIEWVRRYPYPRDANAEFEVEIRKVYEADDFGAAFTPELREAEARMREHLAESGKQLGS
ncbi:MAG: hypothetical protein JWR16_687 [Nevskia sp.]|nr:hypothetical protein [Nevskia sp.]